MSYEEYTIEMEVEREIDGASVEMLVEVTGKVYPGERCRMSGHPDTWYPGSEPYVEDVVAELEDGTELELTARELERAEEKLFEYADL